MLLMGIPAFFWSKCPPWFCVDSRVPKEFILPGFCLFCFIDFYADVDFRSSLLGQFLLSSLMSEFLKSK